MSILLLGGFLGLMIIGVPIAFAFGLAGLVVALVSGISLVVIPQNMVGGANSFPLLAIPFFLLAGNLMNTGGITLRLVDFARVLVGHITGGLGQANVVTNMVMAGMSGSAVADASATASVMIPTMVRTGYGREFSTVLTAAAATIGPIIPPSIPMIIFASVGNVSIGRMFLGGIVPGLLMGLFLMITTYVIAKRRRYPRENRASLRQFLRALWRALPPLMLPFIILGGIFGGVFTPTEAAVVASVYALGLGFVYRELKLSALPTVFIETMKTTSMVMLIISAAAAVGWLMAWLKLPQAMAEAFIHVTSSPLQYLLMVNVILLILGCLIEPTPVIIILGPIFLTAALKLGIDPVQFGVMMVLNLMIGLITPPVGTAMYVTCAISGVSLDSFARHVWPFLLALLLVLLMVTCLPATVTFIPDALLGTSR